MKRVSTNPSYNHPAYYFHAAATYASLQKKKALEAAERIDQELLKKYSSLPPLQLSSIDIATQQYVGQLPVDQTNRDDINMTLAEWSHKQRIIRQYNIPHSHHILDLLQKAHGLYTTRNVSGNKGNGACRRMKLFLIFEIAEEYYASEQYELAKEYVKTVFIIYL